ncbi:MAG: branched-chain amino acid ABC transporter permease [Fimbriimonadaceae bacterium]|nr:branched-chain amino acid ABC transporter permease [Fimbriimonadaceae bacterium]
MIESLIGQVIVVALLAVSISFTAGLSGYLSLAFPAFFGVGAILFGWLSATFIGPWCAYMLVTCLGFIAGLILTTLSRRVRGEYFVIATLALLLLVSSLFKAVDGGGRVILAASYHLFGLDAISSKLLVAVLALSISFAIAELSKRSRLGLYLIAIRDDEELAISLGVSKFKALCLAFGFSGAVSAIAGCVYLAHVNYVDSSLFDFSLIIGPIVAAFLINIDRIWGGAAGALVVVGVPEAFRLLNVSSSDASIIKQGLYGAVLVAMGMLLKRTNWRKHNRR